MAGVRAGIVAWNEKAQVPQEAYGYDSWDARLARYWLYESYLNNTAYSSINTQAALHKAALRLYSQIRPIYNPVARQNRLLTSYVYGGSIDFERMTAGAIPIVSDDDVLLEAIRQLFIWSRWGENKSLYVKWGGVLGDVGIKIVDDRERQKARMEVIHPAKIRDATFDAVGNVQSYVIEYERCEESDPALYRPGIFGGGYDLKPQNWYTYTEIGTKEKFQTFKNGKPFAFYKDADGDPLTEWDNEYGFVPLVIAQHQPTGLKWGENAFYNATRKIDEINDAASLLNDSLRNVIIPLLYAPGVTQKDQIKTAVDEKDRTRILYGPKDSKLEPVTIPIDVPGALQNLGKMLDELERDLPELALQKIREHSGNLTAPGITAAYSDAISAITEARGRYDQAQVRAIQMAISVGGYNGYEGMSPFNLNSYEQGDLTFYIKDRPVIGDTLSLDQKLTKLVSINAVAPPIQKIMLEEMDYDDKTVQQVVAYSVMKEQTSQAQQMQISGGQQPPQLPAGSNAQPQNPTSNNETTPIPPPDSTRLLSIWERVGLNA